AASWPLMMAMARSEARKLSRVCAVNAFFARINSAMPPLPPAILIQAEPELAARVVHSLPSLTERLWTNPASLPPDVRLDIVISDRADVLDRFRLEGQTP